MEQKPQMPLYIWDSALQLLSCLALLVLIVGGIGLGMATRQSDDILPDLDVSFREFRLLAYTTDPTECQPDLLCPRSTREYQVISVVRESAPEYMHETWHRILNVTLQHSVFVEMKPQGESPHTPTNYFHSPNRRALPHDRDERRPWPDATRSSRTTPVPHGWPGAARAVQPRPEYPEL
jgi:hypothetical protein